MADVNQVSSTTPNQVEGEERKPRHDSETGDPSEAAAHENAGGFDGEQYLTRVQKPFEAAATGGSPFAFQPEQVTRLEEDEDMDVLAENKAETERPEKSNLISDPGQEPDSTQEYAHNKEPLIDVGEVKQNQFTGIPMGFMSDFSTFGHEKEEPVVSSHTDPEQDFSSFMHDKEVTHEVEHFTSHVIQEQMISTSHAAQTKEDIFKSYDHKESQEQETDISASVKQPEFAEPQKAFGSFMDEKEEQQRDISAKPVLEETFRSAPVEDTPAAPASPILVELLYWRDVKNSGIVFGASLLLLLSLSVCSIISVLSYVALALLSVTISFRIYKGVLQAIQKSDEGHPFKLYLEQDVALPEDVIHKYSEVALGRINAAIVELRRLFLVEDLVDSLKFAILMWILTYIGALFNGLTILILGLVGAFTCPIIYEKHQAQIDHYVALVSTQVKDIVGKIQAKIPGAKKKAE